MSKKVLSFQQNHEGVMLRFSDNTTVHGDILVGADGAHSSVRQHLYKTLEKEGQLPKTDKKQMEKGYISLVGTTDPLDPAKYPRLGDRDSESAYMIGDGKTPYTVRLLRQPLLSVKNAAKTKCKYKTHCSAFLSVSFIWYLVGDLHCPGQQDLLVCYYPARTRRARGRPVQILGLDAAAEPKNDGFNPSLQNSIWNHGRPV